MLFQLLLGGVELVQKVGLHVEVAREPLKEEGEGGEEVIKFPWYHANLSGYQVSHEEEME